MKNSVLALNNLHKINKSYKCTIQLREEVKQFKRRHPTNPLCQWPSFTSFPLTLQRLIITKSSRYSGVVTDIFRDSLKPKWTISSHASVFPEVWATKSMIQRHSHVCPLCLLNSFLKSYTTSLHKIHKHHISQKPHKPNKLKQ